MDIREAKFQMFEKVKIKTTLTTIKKKIAGKIGTVCGITTPSQTNPEITGIERDLAINIMLENHDQIWLPEELLISLGPDVGAKITLGNDTFVINEKGEMVKQ